MNSCAPARMAMPSPGSRHRRIGKAMLSWIVRLKRRLSWSTTPIWRRSQAGSTWESRCRPQNLAFLRDVKALDKLGQRRLAGAGRPHDADHLAGLIAIDNLRAPRARRADSGRIHLGIRSCPAVEEGASALRDGLDGRVEDVAEPLHRDWTCWKSCHNCDSRSTGCATCPAIMLKATSSPTVNSLSMHRLAPNSSSAALDTLFTYWMAF